MLTIFFDVIRYVDSYKKIAKFNQHKSNLINNSNKRKILLITPYVPYPLNSGAAIRRFYLIQYLALKNDVILVSFTFSSKDYYLEKELDKYCDLALIIKTKYLSLPSFYQLPKEIIRFQSWRMKLILKTLAKLSFDIVIFDSIFTAQYSKFFGDSYQILFEHNIESQILSRTIEIKKQLSHDKSLLQMEKQLQLFKEYENKIWAKFPLKIVVSQQDKNQMENRCKIGQIMVVKNGVDTKKNQPIMPIMNSDKQKILYMGMMGYEPNIDAINYFFRDILPLVWQKQPQITFCIAGSHPDSSILELNNHPQIEVIANPEDINDIVKDCILSVVPIRIGGGTRIKILHSMAIGLPVISTNLGAEGLNVINDFNIVLRDNPLEFAEGILQVKCDSHFREKLRKNARLLVEKEYDWYIIFKEMENNWKNISM
ncbi:glycosyltransferase family 4 protein [Geminocystis sp.]|uniref:glycosyltransferase family 4 protein n=1 Tax=Geminocystis sp. TaxID=2664100 RepID=UPI0035932F14